MHAERRRREPDPLRLLREVFGYECFRPDQRPVIDRLVAGGSALLVMPTGAGKSVCYQIPALVRPGTGLVVSPLIALMQDQVEALAQNGIAAAFLNSSQSPAEQDEVLRRLRSGGLELLYVAPERAMTERFLAVADEIEWSLLAIDEAHCISQWGHEFRPEYRQLGELRARWPEVPCLAVTATADAATRADVAGHLGLGPESIFVTGFDRPNLRYEVVPKVDARRQLVSFLGTRHRGHAGIVYCGTRKRCEQVAGWLVQEGFDAQAYHAGMDTSERAGVQRHFLRAEAPIVVATIAFGMGIDKPDVRFVAHLDVPKSVEAYYQESGRAGRDGEPADCWMAFGWQDVVRISQMIGEIEAADGTRRVHRQVERRKLEQLVAWAETAGCRREALLRYFGETGEVHCGGCDNCESPPQTRDGTIEAQKLLSCVRRTGERFGVVHVIDVLRGEANEKVRRFGHDRLPTFGIGASLDALQWRSVGRQLVALGLLRVDPAGHGALELTGEAWEVLRGEREVRLKVDRSVQTRKARGSRSRKAAAEIEGPVDDALYEALRGLRLELAQELDVPAYVVFHDRTLREMAARRPQTLDELAAVHGVGQSKLERFGPAFLQCLRAWHGAPPADSA